MEVGKDAIQILQYLLPGFLAAWIFYGLTPYDMPSQFERVIHALILTLIIQALVLAEAWLLDSLGYPASLVISTGPSRLIASIGSALIVGLAFSFCANRDTFHGIARTLRITQQTSYPSEWFDAFCSHVTYVVLQLEDGRRLYGWPRRWPANYKEGHLILERPSWLLPDGTEMPMTGVSSVLVRAGDVKWVEFLRKA